MTYKEYCEEADITYTTVAVVDGEIAGEISGFDKESLDENWHKLEYAVNHQLLKDYESLPERSNDDD